MGTQKVFTALIGLLLIASACGKADVAPHTPENTDTQIFLSPAWQVSDWDAFFASPNISRLQFGILFGGKTPYQLNNTQAFVPASNSKLFTAVAALEVLEGGYRFPTEVRWRTSATAPQRAEGLTILGSGDPSWTTPDLVRDLMRSWAKRMSESGIKEISGAITWAPTDSRWIKNPMPAGWSAEDQVACYGARAFAFNWSMNCDTVSFWANAQGRWQTGWKNLSLESLPPVSVQVVLKACVPPELTIHWKNLKDFSQGYVIRGHVPVAPKADAPLSFTVALSEDTVLEQLKTAWASVLKESGIKVTPQPHRVMALELAEELRARWEYQAFTDQSMTVSEMLVPFLKQSINFLGDSLWKAMGSRWDASAPDLTTAGTHVFDTFIGELGAATARALGERSVPGFFSTINQIRDGSGLSRESKLTVDAVMALLRDVLTDTQRKFAPIWNALPIAGVDGTLANRMKGTEAENCLRAKTGTLSGVYNLSGYIPLTGGEAVPFVMLTQTTRDKGALARQTQDEAAVQLVKMVRAQDRSAIP